MQTQCNTLDKILLILKSGCTSRLRRFSKSESRSKEHGSFSAIKAGSNSSLAAGTLSLSSEVMYVDEESILSEYSLEQAIEDGVLVEVFKNRWEQLTGGKPIVATRHVFSIVSLAAIQDIWAEYVDWKLTVEPTLPKEERLFVMQMNGKKVWVIEDQQAITILYPEDY